MKLRPRLTALAGGILLAGLTTVPANADPQCQSGELCFYRGTQLLATRPPEPPGVCASGGGAANWDRIVNRTNYVQYSYPTTICRTGDGRRVNPGSSLTGLGGHYAYSG